jgi:spermidine synthase
MAMEIASGRLIARQFGNSLYTWTSILAVILTGVSVGYYLGGRLADRFDMKGVTGWLSFGASLSILLSLTITHYLDIYTPLKDYSYPVRIFGTTMMAFFLPSILLGSVSPVMVKRALNISPTGSTIGLIGAISTIGGICGTISAGFWLIPILGPEGIVLTAALGMAFVAWSQKPKRLIYCFWLILSAGFFYLSVINPLLMIGGYRLTNGIEKLGFHYTSANSLYTAESQYHTIIVYSGDSQISESKVRVLCLDHLIHGYFNPDDPGELAYEYERIYREITWHYNDTRDSIAALVIGAGSYTFPRWLQYEWPKAVIDVSEIDPAVVEANYRAIELPRNTSIHTHIDDARKFIENLPDSVKYDFCYGDAFDDLSVPWHLTTLEFIQKIKKHLKPDGVYLMNIIEKLQNGLFLGSSYLTIQKVFKHVYIFRPNRDKEPYRRDTFIIAASDRPLNPDDWDQKYGLCGLIFTETDLQQLISKPGITILTDDYAPVDNLLAPVVTER